MLEALLYVLLLLVVMPALLLGIGWLVKTYTEKPPGFIGFPDDGPPPQRIPPAERPGERPPRRR